MSSSSSDNDAPDAPDASDASDASEKIESPVEAALRRDGCHLTREGIEALGLDDPVDTDDPTDALSKVLDHDLREIGAPAVPDDFCKGGGTGSETLARPLLLQVQKVRNVSAPKADEESRHAPRMLKLTLTDGHTACQAVETEPVPGLSTDTPPGTKVQLTAGPQRVSHGFVFVTPATLRVLGGRVLHMIEKWELNRTLAKHTRVRTGGEGSPPPWIPFGQQLQGPEPHDDDDDFKSLRDAVKLADAEFEAQRKGAIAEAQKLSGTKKVFGGGTKPMLDANVQRIVDAGFTEEQAENALKTTRYNADRALKMLQKNTAETKRERSAKQGDSVKGKKGRNRDQTDDDVVVSLKPTGKLSLFDFLEDKLPVTAEPERPTAVREPDLHERGGGGDRRSHRQNGGRGGRSDPGRRHSDHPCQQGQSCWSGDAHRNYGFPREERAQHSYGSQPVANEKPPRFQRKQENDVKRQQAADACRDPYAGRRNYADDRPQRGFYGQPAETAPAPVPVPVPDLDVHVRGGYDAHSYHNSFPFPPAEPAYAQTYRSDVFKRPAQYPFAAKTQTALHNGRVADGCFYGRYPEILSCGDELDDPSDLFRRRDPQHDQRNAFQGHGGNGFYRTDGIVGFRNATINEQARKMLAEASDTEWNVGDRCLAKYWEDNTYYDAEITGVSARTVVVKFLMYGNHEEVLRADCLPPDGNRRYPRDLSVNGADPGNRPGRFHQPVYVPPAQRRA